MSSTHRNRRGITSNKTSHQTIPQHHPGFLGFFVRVWNLVNPMVGCTTARQVELIVSYINKHQPLIINTIAGNAEWSLNKYEWFWNKTQIKPCITIDIHWWSRSSHPETMRRTGYEGYRSTNNWDISWGYIEVDVSPWNDNKWYFMDISSTHWGLNESNPQGIQQYDGDVWTCPKISTAPSVYKFLFWRGTMMAIRWIFGCPDSCWGFQRA